MQRSFAILAPVLFIGALTATATLSAQDKPSEPPAANPATPTPTPAPTPEAPAGDATATSATATSAAELPSAASILERSVVAIGGAEAWSKIKSIETKGRLELPGQGIKGPVVSVMAPPNKLLFTVSFEGIGDFRSGFDGTVGWSTDSISGPRLLEGSELETLKREGDMMRYADPLKRWDKVETVGEGEFGGFQCWKVMATSGSSASTLWFEKTTGLQRGVETTIDTQMGQIPVSTIFREQKEFTGSFGTVKLTVRTEATQMGQPMVTTIDSVVFDAVAPEAFVLPAEIKALLEPEPADEGETTEPAAEPAAPAAPAAPKKEG